MVECFHVVCINLEKKKNFIISCRILSRKKKWSGYTWCNDSYEAGFSKNVYRNKYLEDTKN